MLFGFYDFFIVFLFTEGAERPFFIAVYVGPVWFVPHFIFPMIKYLIKSLTRGGIFIV